MRYFTQKRYIKSVALLITGITAFRTNAQNTVGGQVTVDNEIKSGVQIYWQSGTQNGTVKSDKAGNYLIEKIKESYVILSVNDESYESLIDTVKLSSKSTIHPIKLVNAASQMDAIVIVGYGTQNKRELLGSVSTVKGKDITDVPTQSFESALQGKASGVQVTTGSGMAGSSSLIRVRGVASISASGDPLYVVDGIPITQDAFINRSNGNNYGGGFNNNPLATINPNDIEDITILKDAAATSIYGSRGANGVILITTKRAIKSGLSWEVSSRWGTSQPTKKPDMLSGSEWLQLYQEAWENDGNVGKPDLSKVGIRMTWDEAQKYNTDWVDQVLRTGFKQDYSIGMNYRKKWIAIKGIISYNDNNSYVKYNSYNRASERFNFDISPSKKWNLSISHSLSRGINNRVDAAWAGGLGAAMSTMLPIYPTEPLFNGTSYITPIGLGTVASLKDWRTYELRTVNNARFSYKLAKNLVANVSGSYDYMDYNEHLFQPRELQILSGNTTYPWLGEAQWWPSYTRNYNYYATIEYKHQLGRNNTFNFMAGHEYQNSLTRSKFVKNYNTVVALDNRMGPDSTLQTFYNTPYNWAFISYFGRVNYSFKNKFNVQLTARTDGSSRFGRNNRYGFFPSAALGYVLSDENFIKKIKWINFLKVRLGIGKTGNANFDNYARWGTITPSSNLGQYNGQPQLAPARLENPNLRWESTINSDFGIEAGFLKNRITTELALYNKNTKDVILQVSVPPSIGFSSYYDNIGGIINRGIEWSIKSLNIINKNFSWNTNFNIARNYNEITSIGVYTEDAVSGGTNDTRVVVGQPVGTNFLVEFVRVDQATGRPVYRNLNGNETFNWDPADRKAVGNILPKAFGSLNNNFRYKNFDLGITLYYNIGGNIYESSAKRQLGVVTDWNHDPRIFNRWQKPGDDALYPKLTLNTFTYGSTTPWINTTQWLQDGTFARLRNVSVGYRIPSEIIKNWKFTQARISIVATNLLTWTKYTGLDPEIARDFENATDRNMSGSITYLTAPQEKTYSLQLTLNF